MSTTATGQPLCSPSPGSGKSLLALRIMHEELFSGRVDRIVVVVPSQVLKRQWAAVAQAHGLRLAASWGNDSVVLPPDVHGVIVTYAQVGRLPEALRIQCARHRVFAAFDEHHHSAEGQSWGDGVREAFENAAARLSLSGTAWRGDAAAIPFVRYDPAGQTIADIAYDYPAALADGVCREIYFFTTGGQVRWLDAAGQHDVTFDEAMHPERMAHRLRAALDVSGEWLPSVLRQAAGALVEVRRTHPNAKALVVCMDGRHARAVADLVFRVTGEKPTLALSEDPEAGEALSAFRSGSSRFLVVCKMAGEGYDCPDLRVCLWATNALTELYFRQVVGRVVRMMPVPGYQDRQVFLPSDPRLLAMAQSLLAERVQALGGPQQDRAARAGGAAGEKERPRALFVPLASSATAGVTITGGATIPAGALARAQAFKAGKPALSHLPAHFIAAIFHQLEPHQVPQFPVREAMTAGNAAEKEAEPEMATNLTDANLTQANRIYGEEANYVGAANFVRAANYDDQRLQKRRNCSRLAAIVARAAGEAVETVHRACHQQLGVRQGDASLLDLEAKEQLLIARLQQLQGM